ncbi:MAG: type II secretion system protein [Bacteroidetes bacterium]|nr:type II secretion system protein [Bacteroidota bacterium]
MLTRQNAPSRLVIPTSVNKDTPIDQGLPAFTLTELMVVLIIVGILVLLALPNLMPLITKAKSTEAKLQLEHVHRLERSHFYMYSKYSDNLQEIGFEHEKLVTEDGNANYQVEIIESGVTGFIARATAIVDFDGDGNYNVWEIDHEKHLKEVTPD